MKKIEPWNNVRVTFSIDKDAAKTLKQLAQQNSEQLKRLGIISVQVDGEDIIKLSINSGGNTHQLVVCSRSSNQPGVSYIPAEHSNGNQHLNNFFNQLTNRQEVPGPSGIGLNNNTFAVPPQPQVVRKKSKIKDKKFDDKQNHIMNGPLMGQYQGTNNDGSNMSTPTIPELDEIIDPSEFENLASLAVGKSGFDSSSRSVEEMVTDIMKHEEHLKLQKTNIASSRDSQSHFGNVPYNISTTTSTLSSNSPSHSSHILGNKVDCEVDEQDLLNIPLQHFLTGGTEYQPSLSVSHSPLNTQHQMPYTSNSGIQNFPSTKSNSPHKHPMRQQSYPKGITEMPQALNVSMGVHNVNRQMVVPPGISPHSPMLQNFQPGNGRHSAGPSPQHHAMAHTIMDRRVNPAEYNIQQQQYGHGMYNHYQGHDHGMSSHTFPHKNMDPQIRMHQMNPAWGNKMPPNTMQRPFDPRQQQPYNNNMFTEKTDNLNLATTNSKTAVGTPGFLPPSTIGHQSKEIATTTAEKSAGVANASASPLLVNLLQTETATSSASQSTKAKRKKPAKRRKSKTSAPSTPTTPTTLVGASNPLASAGPMYQRYHNSNMYTSQHNPHTSSGQYFNNNIHMQQNPAAAYGNADMHKNMYSNFQNGNNFPSNMPPKPPQMFHPDHSRPAYIETINRSDVGLRTPGTNTMHMKQPHHDLSTSDPTCVRSQSANIAPHEMAQIHGNPSQVNGLPLSPHHSVRNIGELSMQQSQPPYMFHGQKSSENLPQSAMHHMNMHQMQQAGHMPHHTTDNQMFRDGMMGAGQEEGSPNVVINGSDSLQKAMQIAKNSRQNVTANMIQRPVDNTIFDHNFHGGNLMPNAAGFHSTQKVPNYQQAGLAGPTNFNSSNNNFTQTEQTPDSLVDNERLQMFPTLPETSSSNSNTTITHFPIKSRKSFTTESGEMSCTSNLTYNESNLNPPGSKRAKMSPPDTLPTLPISESSKPRKSPVTSSLSSPCVGSSSPVSQKSGNNSRSNPSTPHHFVSPMGSPMSQSNAGSRSTTPKPSNKISTPRTKTQVRRTSSDQQRSPKTVTGTFTHVNGPQMCENASPNVPTTHQSSSSVPSSPCASQEPTHAHHEQFHPQGSPPQWSEKPNHIGDDRHSTQRQYMTSHNLISPGAAKEQQHIYPQQENFFNSTTQDNNSLLPNAPKTLVVGKQDNKAAQSLQLHS